MIALRKEIPAIRRGALTILKTDDPYIFAYIRSYKGEKYLIVNNLADKRCTAEIELPTETLLKAMTHKQTAYLINILTDEEYKLKVSLKDKKTRLLMYPYAVVWLKLP